jgi:hypothetical protein
MRYLDMLPDRAAQHFDSSRRGVHFDMAIIAIGFYLEN